MEQQYYKTWALDKGEGARPMVKGQFCSCVLWETAVLEWTHCGAGIPASSCHTGSESFSTPADRLKSVWYHLGRDCASQQHGSIDGGWIIMLQFPPNTVLMKELKQENKVQGVV